MAFLKKYQGGKKDKVARNAWLFFLEVWDRNWLFPMYKLSVLDWNN